MHRHVIAILCCLWTGVAAFGENPVARVISTSTVEVDGITAPARNYVPVAVGNEVTTKGASAVLQFPDGSGVTLQPNSSLRLESKGGSVSVHVVRGSAIYDLSHNSRLRMVNSKGETVNALLDHAASGLPAFGQGPPPAVVYRNTGQRQSGMVVPSSFLGGSFVANASGTGTGGPAIVMPNGLTVNLSAAVNPTTGAVTYTVVSVTTTVTLPTGGTTTVNITTGPLIGDVVTPAPPSQTGTSTSPVTITTATGSPVTDPNAALQNTVTTGVTTAVTSGTLPSGTTAPTTSPVSTGQFSPHGS